VLLTVFSDAAFAIHNLGNFSLECVLLIMYNKKCNLVIQVVYVIVIMLCVLLMETDHVFSCSYMCG
jgi:hypothetical protein